MKTILSFLIPSNRPDYLKTKFYDNLVVFEPLKEYIEFCFNFQSPYTDSEADEIITYLSSKGFKAKYTFSSYSWTPKTFSFITLRNDAAKLADPDTLYFVDFDDDITYFQEKIEKSQKVWLHMLIYLLSRPEVGSIRVDTRFFNEELASHLTPDTIYTDLVYWGKTGLGLIYKNIYNGNVLPDELLSLVGSREDKLEYVARAKSRYVIGWLISPDIGVHTEVKDMPSRVRYGLEPLEGNSDTVTTWLSNHWTGIYARYLIQNKEPGFTLDFSKSIEELQQELVKCISGLEE